MSFHSLLSTSISIPSALLALGLAVFVLTRNRRALANRWLAIGLAMIGLHEGLMLVSSLVGPGQWGLAFLRLALAAGAAIPPSWLAFSLIFGESNGGLQFARGRPFLFGLTAAVPLGWIALTMERVIRPVRVGAAGDLLVGLDFWGKVYFSVYMVGLVVVLLHMENLYRDASRLARHRIKFLVVGVFVAFSCQIVTSSYALLYGFIHPLHPFFSALSFLLGGGMIAFSLVRHRLLDVDIFVSRYLIYRSLTLALVGGYLLSLGVVGEVFRWLDFPLDLLTGTFIAILGAVALALLLLSDDIRLKTKNFIHTHFYKHKYDYHAEWMQYTRRVSQAVSIPEIAAQTVDRILEIMWVRQAGMYAVGEQPGQMVLMYQVGYATLPPELELPAAVTEALRDRAKVVQSVTGPEDGHDSPGPLLQEMLGPLPLGCIVPVAALDTLAGLLVVGPEASGKPFGVDDRDLLAAVAAQAGALMLNARLSDEASEGRELQVLARLSAFVAHDLKNTVSMLSMLVDNAKLYIAKPEFQADAIRTLGEVTVKMRKLLATLASPTSRTGTQARTIGLAPSVETWLREMNGQVPSRIRMETRLDQTSEVRVDPEQLRSVLHNLVLNSIEATPKEGTILVETFQENSCAFLVVSDSGRGMTQEFIKEKLFRPFQTTKRRGLGIGLYQCRHIVQSFRGTLTVESQEGKGTRMVVRLPTEGAADSALRA